MKKKITTKELERLGFDESYYDRSEKCWAVRCSRCEASTINGTPCHERGCPNKPKETT